MENGEEEDINLHVHHPQCQVKNHEDIYTVLLLIQK